MTKDLTIFYITIIAAFLLCLLNIAMNPICLPDSPDRFYMGRGTANQCLYMDMNSKEIYESPLQIGAGLAK